MFQITEEKADEIVLASKYQNDIDDYEFIDGEHVYTLLNGDAIVVTVSGGLEHRSEQ